MRQRTQRKCAKFPIEMWWGKMFFFICSYIRRHFMHRNHVYWISVWFVLQIKSFAMFKRDKNIIHDTHILTFIYIGWMHCPVYNFPISSKLYIEIFVMNTPTFHLQKFHTHFTKKNDSRTKSWNFIWKCDWISFQAFFVSDDRIMVFLCIFAYTYIHHINFSRRTISFSEYLLQMIQKQIFQSSSNINDPSIDCVI